MKSFREELWFNVLTRRALINSFPHIDQLTRNPSVKTLPFIQGGIISHLGDRNLEKAC